MSKEAPNFLQSLDSVRQEFTTGLETLLINKLGTPGASSQTQTVYNQLHSTLKYALDAPGKRLRPYLVWLGFHFHSDTPPQDLFWLQLAFEATHTYSLVHDDLPILDDDDLRRGRPTMHKQFSDADALLIGDALCAAAYSFTAKATATRPTKTPALIQLLHNASGYSGMVLGQLADIFCENLPDASAGDLQLLEFIHYHKTGALICGSFLAGFIFGLEESIQPEIGLPIQSGRPNLIQDWRLPAELAPLLKELQEFWLEVGLLFQIKDDLLDVQSSAENMGKNPRKDLDKLTYVTLLGEAGAQKRLQDLENKLTERLHQLADFAQLFASNNFKQATALTRELLAYVAHREN